MSQKILKAAQLKGQITNCIKASPFQWHGSVPIGRHRLLRLNKQDRWNLRNANNAAAWILLLAFQRQNKMLECNLSLAKQKRYNFVQYVSPISSINIMTTVIFKTIPLSSLRSACSSDISVKCCHIYRYNRDTAHFQNWYLPAIV